MQQLRHFLSCLPVVISIAETCMFSMQLLLKKRLVRDYSWFQQDTFEAVPGWGYTQRLKPSSPWARYLSLNCFLVAVAATLGTCRAYLKPVTQYSAEMTNHCLIKIIGTLIKNTHLISCTCLFSQYDLSI